MSAIQLNRDQLADWELVLANLDGSIDAVSKLKCNGDPLLRASSIRNQFEQSTGDGALATALARQLISLASYSRQLELENDECTDNIISSLSSLLTTENTDKLKTLIESALECDSIVVSAKSLMLSFSADTIFRDAKVITDIRPIFNSSGPDGEPTGVHGAVVVQTMQISAMSASNMKSFSVSMDSRDVDDLIKKLQRAKKKATLSISILKEGEIQGFVAGEETYGF